MSSPIHAEATSKHRRGFSVASILSFMSGSADTQTTPIRTVRNSPEELQDSQTRVLLPAAKYPDPSAFSFPRISDGMDTKPLETALCKTTADVRATFSTSISSLAARQADLVKRMHALDSHAKQVLVTTHQRVKKSEKEAELLAGSERLSLLAEKSYTEVDRILKLFREVEMLLPREERIEQHGTHYDRLAPLLTISFSNVDVEVVPRPSKAISSLRSIQEHSPLTSTTKVTASPEVGPQKQGPSSITGPIEATPSPPPPPTTRLRLAPRKSRSNLRAPQIKTVPPLPSTQFSTALPTIERDNMSTRSSMASHRSIFSTISHFLGGQSSARTVNNEGMGPFGHRSAEETLRKISGSSLSGQGRKVSTASRSSMRM